MTKIAEADTDEKGETMNMNPAEPNQAAAKELDFAPVVNGVDFLDSAITNLLDSENPRSLKYAVLHLQAAIEILVKVRLQREGFEHIFEDPYSADENKLRQGKFRSVTLDAALKRLNKVAGIQLSGEEKKAFESLNDERNKLQHFGSTSNHEVVNTHAAKALEVLSQFIVQHLVPNAPEHEVAPLEDAEELIRRALSEIATVTQARLNRVAPELDAWSSIIVHCPDCRQVAWTFAPHDESSRCRFCGRDWSQEDGCDAAEEYIGSILGESRYEAAKGRCDWSISECPQCEMEALVAVVTREDPDSTNACFYCGFITAESLGSCGRCGRTTSDPDDVICGYCLEDLGAED
jgi:hypothetical protein